MEAGAKDARRAALVTRVRLLVPRIHQVIFISDLTALSDLEVEGGKIVKQKPELGRDEENCSSTETYSSGLALQNVRDNKIHLLWTKLCPPCQIHTLKP